MLTLPSTGHTEERVTKSSSAQDKDGKLHPLYFLWVEEGMELIVAYAAK